MRNFTIPVATIATFLGSTLLLLPVQGAAMSSHAARTPMTVPRELGAAVRIPVPSVKPPPVQASVHAKRGRQHIVRVVVIKPPMPPAQAASEKTHQGMPTERSATQPATIVPPPQPLAPQTPILGTPVPPASVQQIPVAPTEYPAVPTNQTKVYQTRTNQTSINSDLMMQPTVGHTRI